MSSENGAAESTRIFDPDYIAELADRHSEDLIRFLEADFKLSSADAQELVADLFGDLFDRHAEGKPGRIREGDNPRNYLIGILKNSAINWKERLKNRPLIPDPEIARNLARGPVSQIVGQEQLGVAMAAMKELSEQERRLLELVDQEGLELMEVARRLNLNRKTASTLYGRAHRKLRAALGLHWSTYIVPAGADTYRARTRGAVAQHVQELPKDYREILLERRLLGLSDAAAAKKLGLSPEAFAERLKTAEGHLEKKTGLPMAEILAILERDPEN